MPRWRRPSLKTARYASPRIAPAPVPDADLRRRCHVGPRAPRVRYDLVALTDIPDEIRGAQVGQLQANDEVEITERQGAWVKVRTPVGGGGLDPPDDAPRDRRHGPGLRRRRRRRIVEESRPRLPPPDSIEAEVAMGAFAAAARARALEWPRRAAVSDPEPEAKPAKRRCGATHPDPGEAKPKS